MAQTPRRAHDIRAEKLRKAGLMEGMAAAAAKALDSQLPVQIGPPGALRPGETPLFRPTRPRELHARGLAQRKVLREKGVMGYE